MQLKAETTFDRLVEMPDDQVSDKVLPTAQLLSHRFLSLYPLLSPWASFKAWWTCFPYTRKFPCQHCLFLLIRTILTRLVFTKMHLCKQQYKYYVCVQLAKFSWGLRVDQDLELLFWAGLCYYPVPTAFEPSKRWVICILFLGSSFYFLGTDNFCFKGCCAKCSLWG